MTCTDFEALVRRPGSFTTATQDQRGEMFEHFFSCAYCREHLHEWEPYATDAEMADCERKAMLDFADPAFREKHIPREATH